MSLNGTGIPNPMPNATSQHRVMADLDAQVWDYFFKGVFPGTKGPRQALICTFFQRFYEACQKENIVPIWDVDNESKVAGVLARLNFNSPVEMPKESKPRRKGKGQ
jgi:hypothetical protein